jgi:serine/threonine-protein kinase
MAPEQAGPRDRPVGARADVYGLGATLYHLVTGRPPFSGPHDEVIRRVPKEPPTPPRDVRRAVPIELEAVILKCLEKDPDRRYQSAEELAADLDRYLAGSVPAAPLLTWRRRVALAVRRNRLGLTVAGAVVLLLIAAAAAWIATRPVDPREQIRKELLAGRPVTLIGESGPPKWHAWAYGPTALGESATGDKTCAFESIGDALLVLLDDPGIDRYAVTADLRILRSKTPADPKKAPDHNEAPGSNRVGLFVSHAIAVASNGQPVPTFLVVSYNDYLSPAIRKLGLTQATAQFELGFVGIRQGAQGALAQPMHDESTTFGINRPIRFTSAEILPGEWRRIRIEVTPDGVRSFWAADPQDPFIPLATVSVAEIARRAAPACTEFVSAHPGAALPLPPWSPRMPLGIWSRGANVAVRNVIVEPLPSPRP